MYFSLLWFVNFNFYPKNCTVLYTTAVLLMLPEKLKIFIAIFTDVSIFAEMQKIKNGLTDFGR